MGLFLRSSRSCLLFFSDVVLWDPRQKMIASQSSWAVQQLRAAFSMQGLCFVAVCLLFISQGHIAEAQRLPGQSGVRPTTDSIADRYNRDKLKKKQAQIDRLRKVINQNVALQKNHAKTQKQLAEKRARDLSRLNSQKERAETHTQAVDSAKRTLQETEKKLIAAQGPESPLAKAEKAYQSKVEILDQVIRDILSLPEPVDRSHTSLLAEHLRLSPLDKATLKADPKFIEASESVETARQSITEIKKNLLSEDNAWIAARDTHKAAEKTAEESQKEKRIAAKNLAETQLQIQNLMQLNAASQQQVARAQAKIKQLNSKN